MAELLARTPCKGLLPIEIKGLALNEVDAGVLTSIAPYRGQDSALSEAMKKAHGLVLPKPNRSTGKIGCRAVWFARGQVMLIGPAPDAHLAHFAALTEQSDGWAIVRLEGAGSEEVLARLVPVDFRVAHFKRGHTVRSELMHMMASVTRVGDQAFQIMVFRSMAETLVHDLKTAMEAVSSRG